MSHIIAFKEKEEKILQAPAYEEKSKDKIWDKLFFFSTDVFHHFYATIMPLMIEK